MVGHGGSSAGSYLADPTSPIPSHCASIVTTNTLRLKMGGHSHIVTHVDDLFLLIYSDMVKRNFLYFHKVKQAPFSDRFNS